MLRKAIIIASLAGMLGATPAMAANSCRDAKGKFVKCTTIKKTAAQSNVIKGKDGKCRIATGAKKGQFTKCK